MELYIISGILYGLVFGLVIAFQQRGYRNLKKENEVLREKNIILELNIEAAMNGISLMKKTCTRKGDTKVSAFYNTDFAESIDWKSNKKGKPCI